MTAVVDYFTISTKGFDDFADITSKVQDVVSSYNLKSALVNVSVSEPCACVMILQNEPGLAHDVSGVLDSIVPLNKIYQHDNIWHDGNAHAHIKASIIGNSVTLPLVDGRIKLADNRQIVVVDFDNKPSEKQIFVTVTY